MQKEEEAETNPRRYYITSAYKAAKEKNDFSQAWRQKVDKARIKAEIAKCKDFAPIIIEYCAGEV